MQEREEVIVVRSLTESDLGLFDAHRGNARSKQRAININSDAAKQLLSPALFLAGAADLMCSCTFNGFASTDRRPLAKSQKNWRLGGKKLEGAHFGDLDAQDFALLRSFKWNNGKDAIAITFIGKHTSPIVHAGIATIVGRDLRNSMAVYTTGARAFKALAGYCTPHGPDGHMHRTRDRKLTAGKIDGAIWSRDWPMPATLQSNVDSEQIRGTLGRVEERSVSYDPVSGQAQLGTVASQSFETSTETQAGIALPDADVVAPGGMSLNSDQQAVVQAAPDKWLLVVAGPGTGKTQVAAMRLVHLLRSGLYPSQILVLSFSRSAVATLTRRIKQLQLNDDAVLEELRHLSIRTFDSWAFRMLRQTGSLPADLLSRTHDENIAEVCDRLSDPEDQELAGRLDSVRHVIVDEFQDLPGVRARMVTELLNRLTTNPDVGFTVLGDPAQAIFRFAERAQNGALDTDPWDDLKSRMGSRLTEISLGVNYRSTEKLAKLAASMRKILRSNLLDSAKKLKAMRDLLDRLPVSPTDEKIGPPWLEGLPPGSLAILTRTNGEAMKVATMILGQAECAPAIRFRLKLSGEGAHAPAWVAALLSPYKLQAVARTTFPAVYESALKKLDEPTRIATDLPGVERAWQRIAHAAGQPDTAASIDMEALRQRLEWPDSFPDDENQMTPHILVTTIHQAKGMEFDNVELLEPQPRKDDDSPSDPLEEANIGFVAITRAGRQLRRLPAGSIWRPLSEMSFPHGRSRQVGWGAMLNMQMGLRGDIDPCSFVDEEILGTAASVQEVQQTLLRESTALRGHRVLLRRKDVVPDSRRHRDARYEVVLQGGKFDGLLIGRTAWQVTEDLLNVLWKRGYGMPNNIYNLRVSDVVTLTSTRDEHRAIPDPWHSSGFWLGVTLFGTGDFKLWKRGGKVG